MADLKEKIDQIKKTAQKEMNGDLDLARVEELRVKFLGRKSELNLILKELKNLSVEEKREIGPLANQTRQNIQQWLDEKKKNLEQEADLKKEWIDVTMPGWKERRGHRHIIAQVQKEIEEIFTSMGFEVSDGPEIDTEYYNFDALNIPQSHPARDLWDTFWIKNPPSPPLKNGGRGADRYAMRPHTSPVQIHYMENNKPPIRTIVPGRCYRNEATDANHEHTFYQFEALVVDKDISIANFKDLAQKFFSQFFGQDLKIRLRPSYFPFTEPSFEFDISCTVCGGEGCKSCKNSGWLEVGGCGMVNQRVFEAVGYRRNDWQGFAWGFGLERLAMMKYKVDDIRFFMSGDLRFLRQF